MSDFSWSNRSRTKSQGVSKKAPTCPHLDTANRTTRSLEARSRVLSSVNLSLGHRIDGLKAALSKLHEKLRERRQEILRVEANSDSLRNQLRDKGWTIDNLKARSERLAGILLDKDRALTDLGREVEELKLRAAMNSFTGETLTKIKATAFAGGFSLGLKFSGIIEKSSGVLFEMDGVLFDMDGEESDV